MNLAKNSIISEYILFFNNKKTLDNNRNAIYQYLSILYDDVKPDIPSLDTTAWVYLQELESGRNYVVDLRNVASVFAQKYSPLTSNLNLTFVCAWLDYCGYPLQKRERQRIFSLFAPSRYRRKEAELTRKLFRDIYDELPEDIRVFLLVLLGSGMRIGEALALKRTDIDWNMSRVAINIRGETTKTKVSRTVYLTDEASSALREYLSLRTDADERVFLFTRDCAQYHFRKAVDKLGYNKTQTEPRLVHWHMTRKWFISRFSLYANKEVAESLAGHEGYLSKSYQRFTKKQILFQFNRADKYLSLFTNVGD